MKDIAENQKKRLKDHREMNSKLHVDIEHLESDIKEIDDLKKQLSRSKVNVSTLEVQIKTKESRIIDLQDEIEAKNLQIGKVSSENLESSSSSSVACLSMFFTPQGRYFLGFGFFDQPIFGSVF